MGGESDFRKWDELVPDALGLIFNNLLLAELLTIVPRVCKSWGKIVAGPYCWQEIDLQEWSKNRSPEIVDRMVRLLISRSGSPRKLCVSGLTDEETILFVANHAQSLHTLCIPNSGITNSIAETISEKLSALTFLDLSFCNSIGAPALESIGKSCKALTTLKRAMHTLEVTHRYQTQDDEALAISSTMPRLEYLELCYMLLNTASVVKILENCGLLKMLDISGCWNVALDESVLRRFRKVTVVGPEVVEYHEGGGSEWDYWSDGTSEGGYLAWDFVAGETEEEEYYVEELAGAFWENEAAAEDDDDVGVWFYEGIGGGGAGDGEWGA